MPVFQFQAEDGSIIDRFVPSSAPDKKRHEQIVRKKGQPPKVYKRVYAAPLAAKDTKVNDATFKDFNRVVDGKKMTQGDTWKISKEMSQHRAEKQGQDPVQEEYYRNHREEYGDDHAEVKRRKANEEMQRMHKEWGVRIDP